MSRVWKQRGAEAGSTLDLEKALGCPPLFARLLASRNYGSEGQARAFLEPGAGTLHAPMLLSGMEAGVKRAATALKRGERIVIYGDYDVDGVTSTTLLMKLFTLLGGQVSYFIPDRIKDGYGLNSAILRRLQQEGAGLVITVDCGVSAVAEAAEAKSIGLDLIITDHHLPGPQLPDCIALINPKTSPSYPYDMLGGVGVAWKFASALLDELSEPKKGEFLDYMLELVALGTVCDVAPLDGENRGLVREGVQRLRMGRWMGLRALSECAGLKPSATDAGHLGFILGPRLNAGGRIGDASLGVRLLLSKDPQECRDLALRLHEENKRRQTVEKEVLAEAEVQAEARLKAGDQVLVLWGEGWHPGVVGLAASRLMEKHSRPVIVFALHEGAAKGSGRSRRPFHLVDALEKCSSLLQKYGGHEFAAGMSLAGEHLEAFRARINEVAAGILSKEDLLPRLDIDLWCGLHEIDSSLLEWMAKMEPFGLKNPKPVLATTRGELMPGAKAVGAGQEHLKLSLRQGNRVLPAIAFRQGGLLKSLAPGANVDFAFTPAWNEFQGNRTIQLEIKDIRPCESPAAQPAAA